MKFTLLVYLGTLISIPSGFAAVAVNFDSAGDFTGYFSSGQSGPIQQSGTGGLNNGGSLDLSGITGGTGQQILTLNQSFAGNTASWSASIYYRGNAQNFWQFGITTEEAPGLNEGWAYNDEYLPVIYFESGGREGGAIGFGNYSPTVSPTAEYGEIVFIPGGLPVTPEWYRYSITVNYLGLSQYSVEGTLTAANADGSLGAVLGTVTSTFTNPELAADETAYLFLNMYDGVALDDFSTTVPEASSGLLAALGLLAAGIRRRPRRS